MAVGQDGTLDVTEMRAGNSDAEPFQAPGSGRLVRQTLPDQAEPVATGLMLPVALDVALPALGSEAGNGIVVRFDAPGALASPTAAMATSSCTPISGTTG